MKPLATVPELRIEVDGLLLAPEDLRTLAGVRVQQRLSLPTLCELVFSDPLQSLTTMGRLTLGAALQVQVVGQTEALFVGQITALEYEYKPDRTREIRVRGYDLLHALRKRQAVRAHVQVTTRDLAQELVSDLGLSVQATESGPLWPRLIQHRQTDLELLQEVAERCGLYLAVRGKVLHLFSLQGLGEVLPLTLGETLLEASLEINADGLCRSVTAAGWNSALIEAHDGEAAHARSERGPARELAPGRLGGSGKRELLDEGAPSVEHLVGLAQAELDQRVAREVTLWGVAEGDTRLRPGAVVEVRGVADAVSGRYVLAGVTHTLDREQGFVSELSSQPPPVRVRARGSVAAPGIVTQIDDPNRLGRVRVALPTYGNVETDWMGVISAGAGAGKGLITLPDIGDRVLVLLTHEDPGQGVVLGGLYGVQEPPDVGIDGGVVKRYTLLTPGGQRIRLDDGERTIRLENSDGSYYELSPQLVRIHAEADLEIEAPGHRVSIRGNTIDFEKG